MNKISEQNDEIYKEMMVVFSKLFKTDPELGSAEPIALFKGVL